jgi:hypothetical protein
MAKLHGFTSKGVVLLELNDDGARVLSFYALEVQK